MTELTSNPFEDLFADAQAAPADTTGPSGNEFLSQDAFGSSRIVLLQQSSKEVLPGSEKYIQDAQSGLFLEQSSSKLLGNSFLAINVFFRTRYNVWMDRSMGTTLLGSFVDRGQAEALVAQNAGSNSTFTHEHVLLIPTSTEDIAGPFLFGMSRSKLNPSRTWNSAIAQAHPKRWAKVWRVSSLMVNGQQGSFFNIQVAPAVPDGGWTLKSHFDQAQAICESLIAAENVGPVGQIANQGVDDKSAF